MAAIHRSIESLQIVDCPSVCPLLYQLHADWKATRVEAARHSHRRQSHEVDDLGVPSERFDQIKVVFPGFPVVFEIVGTLNGKSWRQEHVALGEDRGNEFAKTKAANFRA